MEINFMNFKDKVVYQIYPKSFQDTNGDGIGLMLDMVFNHTSTEHKWFQKALAWEYVPSLKKWYLHLFDVTQADLNWDNPEVREELKQVIRFWKEKGVKGFRFDVVNLISKPEKFENDMDGDGRRFYTDGPHVHEYLKELVKDTGIEEMVTVGEMSSTTLENCIRYSNPAERELSMCFHFHHLKDEKKYWKESAKMLAVMIHLMRWNTIYLSGRGTGNDQRPLYVHRSISGCGEPELL